MACLDPEANPVDFRGCAQHARAADEVPERRGPMAQEVQLEVVCLPARGRGHTVLPKREPLVRCFAHRHQPPARLPLGASTLVRTPCGTGTKQQPHTSVSRVYFRYTSVLQVHKCTSGTVHKIGLRLTPPQFHNVNPVGKHSQVKANSTLDCRDPPNFPKVAQSQAGFGQAAG
jgi:hypothetical protein